MMQVCENRRLPLSALAFGMALSFGTNADEQEPAAVTAVVGHPALDATRDGVREVFQEAGYEDGKNLKWQYQSAQGNTDTAVQTAYKLIGDKSNVTVGVVTPSVQALVTMTKSILIVFSIVTDPVGAHLMPSWEAPGTNVIGVPDMLALNKQIEPIKKAVSGAKRISMVYNPGEANSVVVVKELKELLPKMGLSLVEASVPHPVDANPAVRSLAGEIDAVYTNTDNNVVFTYEVLAKVGNDAKIPLIASNTDSTKCGAIAALGINYKETSKQTGRMVVHILKGEKPGEIKPETSDSLRLFVNPEAVQKQGVTLSDELLKSAVEVIK